MVRVYFGWLTDHNPLEASFDPRCDRYQSGTRITHNARFGDLPKKSASPQSTRTGASSSATPSFSMARVTAERW